MKLKESNRQSLFVSDFLLFLFLFLLVPSQELEGHGVVQGGLLADHLFMPLIHLPKGEVIFEELHDSESFIDALFLDGLQVEERLVEGVLGQLNGLGGVLEGVEEEHRVVQSHCQPQRVRRKQLFGFSDALIIEEFGLLDLRLVAVFKGGVGKVALVVSEHLEEEGAGLGVLGGGHQGRH